uniref:Uncharacterized protein n=1 Tax=Rhizophora mucronata TaxID=61149 RepID=A0A2P2NPM0_RHIMU
METFPIAFAKDDNNWPSSFYLFSDQVSSMRKPI